jgi:hypothetical protein
MRYDINTIGELVDAFGGDTQMAGSLNLSQPAVANWKLYGKIPGRWHLRLFLAIKRRGLSVDPTLFDLTAEEVRGFREPRVA